MGNQKAKPAYIARLLLIVILLTSLFAGIANAAPPQHLNHQGYLTDASAVAVDGNVSITFKPLRLAMVFITSNWVTPLHSRMAFLKMNSGWVSVLIQMRKWRPEPR